MSELAVLTERGQIAYEDEICALDIVAKHRPGRFYSVAPKETPAPVEGFFFEGFYTHSVFEVKSRDLTYQKLFGEYFGEWLITHDKLRWLRLMSKAFRVPGYGILYLKPNSMVLVQKITNSKGAYVAQFHVEKTWTQATCNGGTALRWNAYVQMKGSTEFLDFPCI